MEVVAVARDGLERMPEGGGEYSMLRTWLELVAELRQTPAGRYLRQLWFLYEWLTDRVLPLADAV